MAWKYRKSVKVFPGVRLNLGRNGVSTTIGVRGASVNISSRGTFVNAGIPGTGITQRVKVSGPAAKGTQKTGNKQELPPVTPTPATIDPAAEPGAIATGDSEAVTSPGMAGIKESLLSAYAEMKELKGLTGPVSRRLAGERKQLAKYEKSFLRKLLAKGSIERFRAKVAETEEMAAEYEEQLKLCALDVDVEFDEEFEKAYSRLRKEFEQLRTSAKIWDITSAVSTDKAERSAAGTSMMRRDVAFNLANIEIIRSQFSALHMVNANGGELFLYPGFLLILEPGTKMGIVDFKDLTISFSRSRFLEEEGIPSDSQQVGTTWKKVNKDGSMDKRFAGNYQIPIALYGKLALRSSSGVNEEYMISNVEAAERFAEAFASYKSLFDRDSVAAPDTVVSTPVTPKRAPKKEPPAADQALPEESSLEDSVTDDSFDDSAPNVGAVTAGERGSWVVNPESTFPLTLTDITREEAEQIKALLDVGYNDEYRAIRSLTAVVARTNVRCREIDDYVERYKPEFLETVETLKSASPDWESASAKDRDDLMTTFKAEALQALDVRPSCDITVLFESEPADATIDDALIDRFGFDNLQLYVRFADNLDKVRQIAADNYNRAGFERLVEVGLARRGQDIEMVEILESLKLQELNAIAEGTTDKVFRRKAQAVEHIAQLPDVQDRVAAAVAFRELFQLRALPNEFASIDLKQIAGSWKHAHEVATLLVVTYSAAARAIRDVRDRSGSSYLTIKGWKINNYCHNCPLCTRESERKFTLKKMPTVPLHIGCRCGVGPEFG